MSLLADEKLDERTGTKLSIFAIGVLPKVDFIFFYRFTGHCPLLSRLWKFISVKIAKLTVKGHNYSPLSKWLPLKWKRCAVFEMSLQYYL